MSQNPEHPPTRFEFALVAGIALIAAGVIFGLRNAGFPVPGSILRLWPLLLVLLGLLKLGQRGLLNKGGQSLVFWGLFFLGLQYDPVKTLRYALPLGLLWLGVIITLRALFPRTAPSTQATPSPESSRVVP